MQKYAYGERVVKKVKSLVGHDQRFKDIVSHHPTIQLGDDFCIASVCWNYYELQILATPRGIVYSNRGHSQTIMTYNGFDALLGMR